MGLCLLRKERWYRKCQVRSAKTVAFVFTRERGVRRIVAPYIREENVYFDLDSAKEALKKGEMTVIYEVPANYLQKAKEGQVPRFASGIRSEAQETFFLMHS